MPVEGGLRLPNSQSPCGFRPDSGQDHGIESEWVVLAIDIAKSTGDLAIDGPGSPRKCGL